MKNEHHSGNGSWFSSRRSVVLLLFLAIIGFFMFTEHRAHVFFGGFIFLAAAWEKLYRAQRDHELATTGAYAYVRHPQYVAFIVIMFGFLLQWPRLLTLLMFPVLVWMYVRLARSEERDALKEFGEQYVRHAQTAPAFVPRLRRVLQVNQSQLKGGSS